MIKKLWDRFKYRWYRTEYKKRCFKCQSVGAICGLLIVALAMSMQVTEFNKGYLCIAIIVLLIIMEACYVASFVYREVDEYEKKLSEGK